MNPVLSILLVVVAGLARISAAEEADRENGEMLFLHCFRPSYSQRVVVDPVKGIDGESEPPVLLVSVKVRVGTEFELRVGDKNRHLSGLIKKVGDSYRAELVGAFGSGAEYSGPVKLEKVFDPRTTWFSGAVFPFRCVLSKHKDPEPFLKAQKELDAKKIREATEITRRKTSLDPDCGVPESGR